MTETGAAPRRYLIAAGTRRYDRMDELPEAHADVERIVGLFTGMGYERVLTSVSYEPRAEDLENALADWCAGAELRADDIVVLYYAGHGEPPPVGPYRLACHDSDPARARSWLSPANLASSLASSPVRNVLFIIDACQAGSGAQDIGAVADDFAAVRPRGDATGAGTWVLSSARHRDRAGDGAFVVELVRAQGEGDGPSQKYLSLEKLTGRINQGFVRDGLRQRANCSGTDLTAQLPFFANPFHEPGAASAGDGRTGFDASDLTSHFDPRGRGVEYVHDPGSYFTGRAHALDVLRAHLSGPGGRSALVVTAAPGSGKSAVLGRLVLEGGTARSAHRIDVSVNARHQTLEAMVGRLAAAADVTATAPADLLAALAERQNPFRIVVDSLDEAGPAGDKAEARRIAWELLRPLGEVPCVRLVVGSRSELLLHIGANAAVIDLDTAEYAADTSSADYVERILAEADSPYAQDPGTARTIAEAVARRAGRCFLVARMTASALQRGEPVDVTAPGWADRLPSNVGGAFEEYLERMPRERRALAEPLLTSLAFGEGYGLPRADVWARVAARLSGIPLTESDIDTLVREDRSYLTATDIDGRKHVRLYHQELTDHLRGRALELRDLTEVQHCFVETLLSVVPDAQGAPGRRDWSRAPRYVREHLATHAAAAGAIDDLIEDPAFVLSADITRLLPAVRHAERNPMLAMAIERCADMLGGTARGGDRAAQLAFAAETHGAQEFARRLLEHSTGVERMWAEPRQVTPHRIVGQHTAGTYSTNSISGGWTVRELTTPGGRTLVLAAPPDTLDVHVWDVDDPSRTTVLPHAAEVKGLVGLPGDRRRALAVTLDEHGTLRLWDAAEASLVRQIPGTGCSHLLDAGLLSDRTPVVVGVGDGRVTLWDPEEGHTLVEIPQERQDPDAPPMPDWMPHATCALVHLPGHGAWLLVTDHMGGEVRLCPVEGQDPVEPLLTGLHHPELKALTTLDGDPVALIAEDGPGRDRRLTVLDVASRSTLSSAKWDSFLTGVDWEFVGDTKEDGGLVGGDFGRIHFLPVATGQHRSVPVPTPSDLMTYRTLRQVSEGRVLTVAAGFSGQVRVLDAITGELMAEPLLGHESAVCVVHLLASSTAESLDVLAIGNDGTARLWRSLCPRADAARREGEVNDDLVGAALVRTWSARPDEVIAKTGGTLRTVDTGALDRFPGDSSRISTRPVHYLGFAGEEDIAEGPTGDLNFLAKEYITGTTDGRSTRLERLVWERLSPNGEVSTAVLSEMNDDRPRSSFTSHLLPPTESRPEVSVLMWALAAGQIATVSSPDAPHQVTSMPWRMEGDTFLNSSTACTTATGETILMIAGPDPSALSGTAEEGHRQSYDDKVPFRGLLWNVTAEREVREEPLVLPPRTTLMVPHHAASGARYIAVTGRTGDVRVVDLTTAQLIHVWSPAEPPATAFRRESRRGADDRRYLRWADQPSGPPLLVHGDCSRSDEEAVMPVRVWNPERPEESRGLPMPCRSILWTGRAPNGEPLVAVSDEHGVVLCHLPSCERVWSAPLPALVTSFALLPRFDMAVGTQQGVVLLRPRLTADWRRRLGCSS
ncbi:caspase family protein [Streptomyces inhibens]|uniref:caspase family protein n=1 Tax=Streptomyces inhibens TaxID=2293571 RepID=UPI00402AAA80